MANTRGHHLPWFSPIRLPGKNEYGDAKAVHDSVSPPRKFRKGLGPAQHASTKCSGRQPVAARPSHLL